jgi:sulfotransferase 6B1
MSPLHPEYQPAPAHAVEASFVPPVFFNSVPKSGTHLLLQILAGVPGLMRPWSSSPLFEGAAHQHAAHRQILAQARDGGLLFGHIYYSADWVGMLDDLTIKSIFLYRDPRDLLVSMAYFLSHQQKDQPGYSHLSQCLHSNRDRIRALMTGFLHNDVEIPDFDSWYRLFVGWLDRPNTLCLRFEDVVGSSEGQKAAVASILMYILGANALDEKEWEIVERMRQGIDPATSPTFRRGQVGGWRDEFDSVTKAMFKALVGDLLIQLGYEADRDW